MWVVWMPHIFSFQKGCTETPSLASTTLVHPNRTSKQPTMNRQYPSQRASTTDDVSASILDSFGSLAVSERNQSPMGNVSNRPHHLTPRWRGRSVSPSDNTMPLPFLGAESSPLQPRFMDGTNLGIPAAPRPMAVARHQAPLLPYLPLESSAPSAAVSLAPRYDRQHGF